MNPAVNWLQLPCFAGGTKKLCSFGFDLMWGIASSLWGDLTRPVDSAHPALQPSAKPKFLHVICRGLALRAAGKAAVQNAPLMDEASVDYAGAIIDLQAIL